MQTGPKASQQMLASPGPAGLLPLAAGCWDDLQVSRGSPTPSGGTASADRQRSHCPLSHRSKVQVDDRNNREAANRFCLRLQTGSSPCTWSQLHPDDPPTLLDIQEPEHKAALLTAIASVPLSLSQWSQLQIATAYLKGLPNISTCLD